VTNPFPGFNPFLEAPAFWSDFHSRFINYWCEAIADRLPGEYEASISERVYLIEHDLDARKLISPDVSISVDDFASRALAPSSVATLEPTTIPLVVLDGPRETFIEILHRSDRALVTSIELLSPANKQPPGRFEYLAKRRSVLSQQVHLVELDLLRAGQRVPFAKPLPPADYYYIVSRYEQRPDCQVYAWQMPHELPTLPIPLRAPDPDIHVSLSEVFETTFERGRFQRRIDYSASLGSTLSKSEKEWLHQQISKQVK
jgi:hypothetical protein